jgi:DUF4097 and DUF4098 domain-containing protein YvlB
MKQNRNRNRVTVGWLSALVVLLLAGSAAAERSVDRKAAADPEGTIYVENLAGEVNVEGWDRAEVELSGTLADEVEKLIFDADGGKTRIRVVYPEKSHHTDGSYLTVRVPEKSRVDIETVSAEIEVSNVVGRVDGRSVSGDVTVRGMPEEVDAATVSGSVELDVKCDQVYVQSVSGDVDLEGAYGEVEAESVSGEITITGDSFRRLDAESVSGDVEFRGGLDKGAVVSIDTHSGDIVLMLPAAVSAEFEINTFSGDIENDFGPSGKRSKQFGPGKELEFTTGGGDARVRIETFSGDVELLRR